MDAGRSWHSSAGGSDHLAVTEVLAWAAVANSSDDVEAALRLLDLPVQLASSETVSTSVDRARLLLLSGRPDDGLAVLTKAGVQRVGQGASATDCVLAACLAATGEQNALDWLLWAASHVPETARWWTTYLIAAAGEGQGEWEISGRAWRALVFDHGIRTDLTVPRAVAAMVEARDRSDVVTAVGAVARAAALLSEMASPPDEDANPALSAVTVLRAHGDAAGARLLLTALVARLGQVRPLVQALQGATPIEAEKRYVRKSRLAGGAALLALAASTVFAGPTPLHVVALVALVLGRNRWHRLVGVPGFDKVDSGVWRAFRAVHHDVRTGVATTVRHRHISRLDVAGVFVGLTLALPVATTATGATRQVLGTSTPLRLGLGDCVGTTVFFAVVAAAIAVSTLWQRSAFLKRGEMVRQAHRRSQGASLSTCRCWDTARLTGSDALHYSQQHLALAREADLAAAVQPLGADADLFTCVTTGMVWLSAPLALRHRRLLLRGSVPDRPDVPVAIVGGTAAKESTGFYL